MTQAFSFFCLMKFIFAFDFKQFSGYCNVSNVKTFEQNADSITAFIKEGALKMGCENYCERASRRCTHMLSGCIDLIKNFIESENIFIYIFKHTYIYFLLIYIFELLN